MTPMDFGHTPELVADAHASTAAFLDELVLTGPGLYGHPGVPSRHWGFVAAVPRRG